MYAQVFELHANLLKALAHPKRLEIIQLVRDKELNVTQIQQMLGLPQANLSQHLMVLREEGVVLSRKKGKEVVYRMPPKNFVEAADLMREVLVERYKGDKEMTDELSIKMQDLVPVVVDPVCGMRVSPKTASCADTWKGEHYYFCGSGCLKQFKERPEKFVL